MPFAAHLPLSPLSPMAIQQPSPHRFSESERRVLDALRREGALSRADLARSTGLAKPSVSRVVEDMVAAGLIETGALRKAGRGKPGLDVSLVADAAFGVGISLMTDAFVVSLLDLVGTVQAQVFEPFAGVDRDGLVDRMRQIVDDIIGRHVPDRRKVLGVGLGVTGFFVDGTPRVNPPPPLDAFALIDLEVLFQDGLGLPVMVENDGSTAAVGEMLNGVGAETADFAYLYFSAGFGGGMILNGRLWRGVHGNAGEFAGLLPARYAQPNLEGLRRSVAESGGPRFDGLGQFLAAFDLGWPGVETWLDGALESLALVCAAIHSTLDVEAIVLGGRIPPALALVLIERIDRAQVPRRGRVRPLPRLVCARSAGDATSTGAAALVFRSLFF